MLCLSTLQDMICRSRHKGIPLYITHTTGSYLGPYYFLEKCYRPCKFNVKPKRCHYKFNIEPSIGDNKFPISINGIAPGPPIYACVNDVIVVEVTNRIPGQSIAVHWHGVEQRGTPFMDGVPMVTQCPVEYGTTYKYLFVASSPGTFFYHADSVAHQSDGVYGLLVVNQPQPLEPHASIYDFDRGNENSLLIGAKFPVPLTGSLEDTSQIQPNALVINSDEETTKLFVLPGYAYRLRLINAVAIECPVTINIDSHDLMIIATDGKPVKPVMTHNVQLYPGERMDVVVRMSQSSGGYWVRARGADSCAGLTATAMLLYSGFNYTSMLLDKQNDPRQHQDTDIDLTINGQMLESSKNTKDASHSPEVKSVYLSIDKNVVNVKDNDFRYISDAIPKKPYYPAPMFLKDNGVVQINGKSFLYPNAPILLQPKDVREDLICNVGEEGSQLEAQCIQILNAVQGETMELVLVNEGFGGNDSYTFHMHGFSMQVVSTWRHPHHHPLTREEVMRMDEEGRIVRNLKNPVNKDTITIPNKGFMIVRIALDRGGSWLLECRSCGLSLPAAVIIQVPLTIPKDVSESLHKCGSYRPPDVLLN
ncbi:hypothetical protein O3G_MSEX005450 [Manduca sexta]|uniref:Uncharacterized protein n=1 Tax=Manduca sexta TaxID=7130 RepID=A0A921YYS6_MANSE|nr:hypothetical protein O3G_MSEX005450 [Manduca sexta]